MYTVHLCTCFLHRSTRIWDGMQKALNTKYLRRYIWKENEKERIDKEGWFTQNILWEPIELVETDLKVGAKLPGNWSTGRERNMIVKRVTDTVKWTERLFRWMKLFCYWDLRECFLLGYHNEKYKTTFLKVYNRDVKQFHTLHLFPSFPDVISYHIPQCKLMP